MRQVLSERSLGRSSVAAAGAVALALGEFLCAYRLFLRLRDLVEAVLTYFSNLCKAQKELLINI